MVFSLLPTVVLADGEDPDTSAGSGQVMQQNPENPDNQAGQDDQASQDDLNDSENSDDSDALQLLGEGGEGATTTAVPELVNPTTEGTRGGRHLRGQARPRRHDLRKGRRSRRQDRRRANIVPIG